MFPVQVARGRPRSAAKAALARVAAPAPSAQMLGPYYFFEARVKVDRETWDAFQAENLPESAKKIVELLESVGGLKLRHAGTFTDDEYYHFYNFWELGFNANALAEAELSLADNVLWAQFSKVVQREEDKQIIFPITSTARTDDLPDDLSAMRYLRVEYSMEHFAFAEVQARLEAELVPEATRNGWYFGFSYLHLTGREGSLVQVWLVPDTLTPKQADEAVSGLSWLRPLLDASTHPPTSTSLFKGDPEVTLLRRSTFDNDPRRAATMLTDVIARVTQPDPLPTPAPTQTAQEPTTTQADATIAATRAAAAASESAAAVMNAAAAAMNAAAAAMNAALALTNALNAESNPAHAATSPQNGQPHIS